MKRGAHTGVAVGHRVYAIEGIAGPPTACCLESTIVEALDVVPRLQQRPQRLR